MKCFLNVLTPILWTWQASAVYHELSQEAFKPSTPIAQDALFGYSITYIPHSKRLIISAPKADRIGDVFTCDIRSRYCKDIPNQHINNDTTSDNLWFGATVKAGLDFFITCAPRYREKRNSRYGTYSHCYAISSQEHNLLEMEQLTDNDKEIVYEQERRMDSLGWSMDVGPDGYIVIGGPAMYKGRAVSYYNRTSHPELISAKRTKIKYNFGYSISTFRAKNGEPREIAISSPYGQLGYGMTIIYDGEDFSSLLEDDIKKLRRVGSLFGASMCYAKLYSHGYPSLLIGAPTYAQDQQYNTGAVFIYKRKKKLSFHMKIHGRKNGGYFGNAIVSLGDLNGDEMDEIAIAAPYEDDGRGAVYIYSGAQISNSKGAVITWLQRIQSQNYYSFGLSLSALQDFDENGCNELAIGAPNNNTAVLLRCMATITLTLRKLHAYQKVTPKGSNQMEFKFCSFIQYPPLPKTIKADILVQLEITHTEVKLGVSNKDVSLFFNIRPKTNRETKFCFPVTVFPLGEIHDPVLQYQIRANLLNDPTQMSTFDPSRVLLSDLSVLSIIDSVWIGNCKIPHECIPKLTLEVVTTFPRKYEVGSTDIEKLSIQSNNTGDTAYGACARVHITGVRLLMIPKCCTQVSNEQLICKPLRLLQNNSYWNTGDIKFDTKSLQSEAKIGVPEVPTNITMTVHLYEDCDNGTITKHNFTNTVTLISNSTAVTIQGQTNPGDIVNVTMEEAKNSGKQIQHVYSIVNSGPTTWVNVQLKISLRKNRYIDKMIVPSGDYVCTNITETIDNYQTVCDIAMIKRINTFDIILPIDLLPGTLESALKTGNASVVSQIEFFLKNENKSHSIISTVVLYEVVVPIWIIIIAVLFGVFLVIIIAFAMYECGFLRRKNKEKLSLLKKDVRRQSIRRSMVVRKSEQENISQSNDSLAENAPIEVLELNKNAETQNTQIKSDMDPASYRQACQSDKLPIQDMKTNSKFDMVITGLQKNIQTRQKQGSSS